MIKVDVFSGFLGAGKTTLIKKLIEEAYVGEKLVLIENEYGNVNIDSAFLRDTKVSIKELSSGCICCSISGDFGSTLDSIVEWMSPDRILIEPSGVGKLSDVMRNIRQAKCKEQLALDCVTTIVDAKKCRSYSENFGDFYIDQISSANCILMSRTTEISSEKLESSVALIREHNSAASLITKPWDQISGSEIRRAMEQASSLETDLQELEEDLIGQTFGTALFRRPKVKRANLYGKHKKDSFIRKNQAEVSTEEETTVFSSWGMETTRCFSKEEIREILDKLKDTSRYGTVLRAKGSVVGQQDSWIYFDFVPEETNIRDGIPDVVGKICLIGTDLQEDALEELLS